jgi:hypothetical protein
MRPRTESESRAATTAGAAAGMSKNESDEARISSSGQLMGWYDFLEDSLASWAEQAQGYRLMHEKAFSHYSKISFNLTIPAIILSTLTGVANFGQESLAPYLGNDTPLYIGVLSIAAAMLSTIAKYVRADEKAETHRNAMINWDKLYRTIVTELTQPRKARIAAQEFLLSYREERHRLTEQAPIIPYKIRKWFKEEYKEDYANTNISKPNILSLVDVQIFRGETMSRKGEASKAETTTTTSLLSDSPPLVTPTTTTTTKRQGPSPSVSPPPPPQPPPPTPKGPLTLPARIETATQSLTSAEGLIKQASTMISGIPPVAATASATTSSPKSAARHAFVRTRAPAHNSYSPSQFGSSLTSKVSHTSPSRTPPQVFSLSTQQKMHHMKAVKEGGVIAPVNTAASALLAETAGGGLNRVDSFMRMVANAEMRQGLSSSGELPNLLESSTESAESRLSEAGRSKGDADSERSQVEHSKGDVDSERSQVEHSKGDVDSEQSEGERVEEA